MVKDKDGNVIIISFELPNHWEYESMIDFLAKRYGQCKHYVEENYTRYDYYETLLLAMYENIGTAYRINKK